MAVLRGSIFKPLEPRMGPQGPILGSRGSNLSPREVLESKAGEKQPVFIFGRGSTQPGALLCLISPPSPELWLRL